MPGPGRKFGKGNPGKPKGATSHLTRGVKEAFEAAFRDAQEDPTHPSNLGQFSKEFPREFIAAASKLIPTEVKAEMVHRVNPEVGVVLEAMGAPKK